MHKTFTSHTYSLYVCVVFFLDPKNTGILIPVCLIPIKKEKDMILTIVHATF